MTTITIIAIAIAIAIAAVMRFRLDLSTYGWHKTEPEIVRSKFPFWRLGGGWSLHLHLIRWDRPFIGVSSEYGRDIALELGWWSIDISTSNPDRFMLRADRVKRAAETTWWFINGKPSPMNARKTDPRTMGMSHQAVMGFYALHGRVMAAYGIR